MKISTKSGMVVACLAALTASSMASPFVGTWHGRLVCDISKMGKPKDAAQKAQMVQTMNQIQTTSLALTMRADHSWSIVASGSPFKAPPQTGTWAVSGGKMSITTYNKGKPAGPPLVFLLSKDNRSFTTVSGYVTVTYSK